MNSDWLYSEYDQDGNIQEHEMPDVFLQHKRTQRTRAWNEAKECFEHIKLDEPPIRAPWRPSEIQPKSLPNAGVQDVFEASRDVRTTLQRPLASSRKDSEKRERLETTPDQMHRRANSAEPKHGHISAGNVLRKSPVPFRSAPQLATSPQPRDTNTRRGHSTRKNDSSTSSKQPSQDSHDEYESLDKDADASLDDQSTYEDDVDMAAIQQEYKDSWITNLSMHFRDKSNREKFFVTYAQEPALWRRLTISLDYRDAVTGSLEEELGGLSLQREKSFRIFDALRGSLPNIKFFSTVTNLKLETTPDGQLHVHVREDTNEIIDYPSASLLEQVQCESYTESELAFYSHISGFVYKVRVEGKILIKKEIPGPDTIDEFLYEVNALDALHESEHVVKLEGLITSNDGSEIKGLLLPFIEKGALVDVLYDWELRSLSIPRRLQWARQIIKGLSDIHEAGFVQGDFTLSNIVIDNRYNAHIIDINRRGCPIGWEPPELANLIDQGQRISMFIGVKTDIFQLGMVLWALSEINDEPERQERPLPPLEAGMPSFYQKIVTFCMHDRPQNRPSAINLLRLFDAGMSALQETSPLSSQTGVSERTTVSHRSDQERIPPELAVTLDDINKHKSQHTTVVSGGRNTGPKPASSSYRFTGSAAYTLPPSRGRSPQSSWRRRDSVGDATNATSLSPTPDRLTEQQCDTASSYPKQIRDEDLVSRNGDTEPQQRSVPPLYHRIQHEDSGFDERMVEEYVSPVVAGASNLEKIKEHSESQASGVDQTGQAAAEHS